MLGPNDPTIPMAETGTVALEDDDGPQRSRLLDEALAAGLSIQATLAPHVDAHLDPQTRERFEVGLARAAATSAYAGMALWALNAFTVRSEQAGGFAEALAGLGLGVLSGRP